MYFFSIVPVCCNVQQFVNCNVFEFEKLKTFMDILSEHLHQNCNC